MGESLIERWLKAPNPHPSVDIRAERLQAKTEALADFAEEVAEAPIPMYLKRDIIERIQVHTERYVEELRAIVDSLTPRR